MTYDQAQSPRLGQRTPIESTYVRMFFGEEIPEAAWRGQLIYRQENQNLQIWDDTAGVDHKGAWLNITGGVSGLLTFVQGEPPPISLNEGDIWFNSDDGHHQYRAAVAGADHISTDGTGWESVQDDAIGQLQQDMLTALDTADTADGRVSMSDWDPGPYDIEGHADGSIWFTRSRPRTNLCTNPSFETNTTFWSAGQATIARVTSPGVPAGLYTLQVTNSATAGDHWAGWTEAAPISCAENEVYTVSIFAELVSGVGAGITLQVRWYDSTGTYLSTSASDPYQLILNAWIPTLAGTTDEPRVAVTVTAPTGAAFFNVRMNSPVGNEGDIWHTGALLVELDPEYGRYFDGDSTYSPDCSWLGTPQNSASVMVGDKITAIWELHNGNWTRKYLTSTTVSDIGGITDGGDLSDNTVPTSALANAMVTASEALTAGDLVNVWNNAGAFAVRRASAQIGSGYPAHGFVLDTVASGAQVHVHYLGEDAMVSGTGYDPVIPLIPGTQFLSWQPGRVMSGAPAGEGYLVQQVGYAVTSSVLDFQPHMSILRVP